MYPSQKEFLKLSKKGNLIPIYEEILGDLETPVSAYLKTCQKAKYAFLLESVEGGEKVSRYSFLSKNPEIVLKSQKNIACISSLVKGKYKNKITTFCDSPLEIVEKILGQYKFVSVKGLPRFCGGFVGYMGYDIVRFFESLPEKPKDDLDLPDMILLLVKDLIIFDHFNHTIKIVCCVSVNSSDNREKKLKCYKRAKTLIRKTINELKQTTPKDTKIKLRKSNLPRVESSISPKKFKQSVMQAKEQIRKGEIIQVVLSQRFKTRIHAQPINIYRALRTVNPSPYMYFLRFDDVHLIGSSPELLIRCENKVVETRPIAGTRPRGETDQEDRLLENTLISDPKERAEHIMLVDLGRNDLGRICKRGSIQLTEFMRIEHYSHVMHIVSNIKGTLDKNKTIFDVLKSGFPAGTVSGAPKIRAMQLIDQLEPISRGPYAGCVGYLGFSGNLDTCITIRTIIVKGAEAYIQAGAGIVADSDPEKEFLETSNKAKAQINAIKMAHQNFP